MYKKTYCNPLSIPNYATVTNDWPVLGGFLPVTGRWDAAALDHEIRFDDAPFRNYRSLADVDVMYHEGIWYMYGSFDCAYSSTDLLHWKRHELTPYRYDPEGLTMEGKPLADADKRNFQIYGAPTAAFFRGKFYLVRNLTNAIYWADTPFGPFEKVGELTKPDGSILWMADPCLFVDEDRLYLYFGSGEDTGIQGVELDPQQPNRLLADPVRLVSFRPETGWECHGARYQNPRKGSIEGADMIKRNGRYYLIYAANGVRYDTYNMGVYYSDEGPLSGFIPQPDGPFCQKRIGICKGAGHGCVTEGPDGSLWVLYTSVAAGIHCCERRIGMDKVIVTSDGMLAVPHTTDEPQWAPGVTEPNAPDNAAGLKPLNIQHFVWATSAAPGRDPHYAVDDNMSTWWEPDAEDTKRQIVVDFRADYTVYASRVLWKELNLDLEKGILPGPVQYVIEVTDDLNSGNWTTVVDTREDGEDYLNDYRTFDGIRATNARLTICGGPKDLELGVISFVMYGIR